MGRALPVVIAAVLAIYCVVQVVQSRAGTVRVLPRWLWVLVILVVPLLGPIAWLVAGRPRGRPSPPRRNRPVAPDDDPDFLRGLRDNKPREPGDKPDDTR
jgi:hypothetical protein